VRTAAATASAQEVDLRRGETAGVDAYVTKPFDPESLVRTIRDLIALKAS
jgi:CheY-like chemotaxis protein